MAIIAMNRTKWEELNGLGWTGEVDAMRFPHGFIFGAFYTGNRAFRVAFLLIMVFCLYQMSKPLGHNRRVASPCSEAC